MNSAKRVICRCDGVKSVATFVVEDRFLVLKSSYGTVKVAVGLQDPRKVAGRLFKKLCGEANRAPHSLADTSFLADDSSVGRACCAPHAKLAVVAAAASSSSGRQEEEAHAQ